MNRSHLSFSPSVVVPESCVCYDLPYFVVPISCCCQYLYDCEESNGEKRNFQCTCQGCQTSSFELRICFLPIQPFPRIYLAAPGTCITHSTRLSVRPCIYSPEALQSFTCLLDLRSALTSRPLSNAPPSSYPRCAQLLRSRMATHEMGRSDHDRADGEELLEGLRVL